MTLARSNTPLFGPALWLDGSGPDICGALWETPGPLDASSPLPRLRTRRAAAARGVFQLVEDLLGSAGMRLEALRSVAHAEGPGSALGLRVVAMALRTWASLPCCADLRFLAAYSTDVLAASAPCDGSPFTVAFPMGRLAWSAHRRNADGSPAEATPERIPREELGRLDGRVLFPTGHKLWDAVPANFVELGADPLRTVQALVAGRIPLRPVERADVFPREAPQFRKLGEPRRAAG